MLNFKKAEKNSLPLEANKISEIKKLIAVTENHISFLPNGELSEILYEKLGIYKKELDFWIREYRRKPGESDAG
jgi:hypothetical protein